MNVSELLEKVQHNYCSHCYHLSNFRLCFLGNSYLKGWTRSLTLWWSLKGFFRRVRKIAKSDNWLRHVSPSVRQSICRQGTTRLPPERFSWNL